MFRCLCLQLTLLYYDYVYSVVSVMLSLLLSGELRNLVGSILGGQTGSNISLEQVRMVGGGGGGRGGGRGRGEGDKVG